jgi:hypothetical protein
VLSVWGCAIYRADIRIMHVFPISAEKVEPLPTIAALLVCEMSLF